MRLIHVDNVGPGSALEMTINIQHFDYYPDTPDSGLHLILHGQDETPVKMQGVILSPGFKTFVEVRKRKVGRLFGFISDWFYADFKQIRNS